MKTFDYHRADTVAHAVALAHRTGGRYFAGGTNLLDLMKTAVVAPSTLIDINRLQLTSIHAEGTGVRIGAGATNSALANHPLVRTRYPVLSQAVLSGATTQLRNMATVGGNLMQRTRCPYFMDDSFTACNKRRPGSGCAARAGVNREHALFGTGAPCVAVHPSDMAVALSILDAVVHVTGPHGDRAIPIAGFYRLPDDRPDQDNTVRPAELITAVDLPAARFTDHSWYLKIRDRRSYAFALVSVAAGLELEDGVIRAAALALGGVAATPWRVSAAEDALIGRPASEAGFRLAADLLLAGAEPLSQNGFKVDLARHGVVRALQLAVGRGDRP